MNWSLASSFRFGGVSAVLLVKVALFLRFQNSVSFLTLLRFFSFYHTSQSTIPFFFNSGLAVEPNMDDQNASDSIFNLAESAGSAGGQDEPIRRPITMYREGFVVDDGPYRRLDDPQNAPFLRALARGETPEELAGDGSGGNTTVGLIDKRNQDYVETFRSFSGAGQSLGASTAAAVSGVFDPAALPAPTQDESGAATTSIAVRMLDGSRKVVKIALSATVQELAARVAVAGSLQQSFRIVAGFPPKPLEDGSQTVEAAGLKGARVQLQKA